jgi:cytochrome P450
VDEPAVMDIDGYLADPRAELDRCAALGWYAEAIDAHGAPMPIVLDHDHVRSTLKDRRLSTRSFVDDMLAAGITPATVAQLTPLFGRHGEEHRVHRGLLAAAFTPRRIERMRPVAAGVAARLSDAMAAAGGRAEFVSAFAAPLPAEVFAVLFGLPAEDSAQLSHWSTAIFPAFTGTLSDAEVAGVEDAGSAMRSWAAALVAARRRTPTEDLVTKLIDAEIDGERLDDDDIVALVTGFVFAGTETTKRQLTELVSVFAEHPGSWDRVAADPALVPNAIEEVLRLRGIIPGLTRVAVEPFELDGLEVATDGRVVASIATANRDPEVFAQPTRFDVARENASAQVTFGWGPHLCVGAGLARLELQEALRALAERFEAPVVEQAELSGVPGAGLDGADSLVVRWQSRRG